MLYSGAKLRRAVSRAARGIDGEARQTTRSTRRPNDVRDCSAYPLVMATTGLRSAEVESWLRPRRTRWGRARPPIYRQEHYSAQAQGVVTAVPVSDSDWRRRATPGSCILAPRQRADLVCRPSSREPPARSFRAARPRSAPHHAARQANARRLNAFRPAPGPAVPRLTDATEYHHPMAE